MKISPDTPGGGLSSEKVVKSCSSPKIGRLYSIVNQVDNVGSEGVFIEKTENEYIFLGADGQKTSIPIAEEDNYTFATVLNGSKKEDVRLEQMEAGELYILINRTVASVNLVLRFTGFRGEKACFVDQRGEREGFQKDLLREVFNFSTSSRLMQTLFALYQVSDQVAAEFHKIVGNRILLSDA